MTTFYCPLSMASGKPVECVGERCMAWADLDPFSAGSMSGGADRDGCAIVVAAYRGARRS